MRVPREGYQWDETMAAHLPELRPAQRLGLARWGYGAGAAGSACPAAVIAALRPLGLARHALRQTPREWLYDRADKVAAGPTHLAVTRCFALLRGWVVHWGPGPSLALAVDATSLGDRLGVLSVSVRYRGCAIPVAWHVVPAGQAGEGMRPILGVLDRLGPAGWRVLGLADRGLWSPRRHDHVAALGWPPRLRRQRTVTFRPAGPRQRVRARSLGPGPEHAGVGAGIACQERPDRRAGPRLVGWEAGATEPWVLLTTRPPEAGDVCWDGLRAGIELGFRALKSLGWHWERTRRPDPDRVARHWLVLAHLRVAPPPPPRDYHRWLSVFVRGIGQLRTQLRRQRRGWAKVWLGPEAWPDPAPHLIIVRVQPSPEVSHA